MGKKSSPTPIIPEAKAPPPIIDRDQVDAETASEIKKAVVAKTSTVDGKAAPQASLLKERSYWDDKKSLLSK